MIGFPITFDSDRFVAGHQVGFDGAKHRPIVFQRVLKLHQIVAADVQLPL